MPNLTGRALSKACGVPILLTEEDIKGGSVSAHSSDKETINWENVQNGAEALPTVENELKTLK